MSPEQIAARLKLENDSDKLQDDLSGNLCGNVRQAIAAQYANCGTAGKYQLVMNSRNDLLRQMSAVGRLGS